MKIAVFDSGFGSISIIREIQKISATKIRAKMRDEGKLK